MGNRQKLLDAICAEVDSALRNQSKIDIDFLAIELSSRYPQSGLPIDAICREIEQSMKSLDDGRREEAI